MGSGTSGCGTAGRDGGPVPEHARVEPAAPAQRTEPVKDAPDVGPAAPNGGSADGPVTEGRRSDPGGADRSGAAEAAAADDPASDPATDPATDAASLEADARTERLERVAVLYGEITAATRQFLAAVAACDRHRDWAEVGLFGSCAEWLAWRIGITRGTANEKVRVARALEELPLISGAMARGELSYSKVRALSRVATADNEAELLEFAGLASAARLERFVRGFRDLSRGEEQARERRRYRSRRLSVFPDEDGMYVVRGRLPPEVGAAVMRAVEAAGDALFAESSRAHGEEPPEPRRLRADALGLVAERALAAGFGCGSRDGEQEEEDEDEDAPPLSGTRAERYQVMLHVEAKTLGAGAEPGLSELEDGTRISAETARRLACDASPVEVEVGRGARDGSAVPPAANRTPAAGPVLGAGRKRRTVPPSTRRALEARDRGCRFPGCGLRFTDAHHITH